VWGVLCVLCVVWVIWGVEVGGTPGRAVSQPARSSPHTRPRAMLSGTRHPLLWSAGMAGQFVGWLYLWPRGGRGEEEDRNDLPVVQRRCLSVTLATGLALWMAGGGAGTVAALRPTPWSLVAWLGGERAGAHLAWALLLTASLFTGPLVVELLHVPWPARLGAAWRRCKRGWERSRSRGRRGRDTKDIRPPTHAPHPRGSRWLPFRDYVCGPITEELVFRHAILSVLLHGHPPVRHPVAWSALLFALAHAHHGIASVCQGRAPWGRVVVPTLFQGAYTFAFGWYAALVHLRSGGCGGGIPPLF
jgi:hypothetical protein